MPSSISVIISTYNRAPILERVLGSLTRQSLTPDRFEVVVVDDASTDDTARICDRMRSGLPNLQYVRMDVNVGQSIGRNRGIDKSSGDHLLFIDDDCIADEQWVERMSAALNREPIAGGAVASPARPYAKLCHNIAQYHAFMPGRKARITEVIAGANMAFRRTVIKELNGFQPNRKYAEEWEIMLRAQAKGYRAMFVPGAVVIHDHDRTTLAGIVHYSATHAAETIILRNRYRSLLNTPYLFRSPVFLMAASPLLALEATVRIYLRDNNLAKLFWTIPSVYATKVAWCWGAALGLWKHYKHTK